MRTLKPPRHGLWQTGFGTIGGLVPTGVVTRDAVTGPASPSRTQLAAAPEPAPPRQQRRKSIIGLGVALIALGVLAGAWYGSRSDETTSVLVLSQSAIAGDVLTRDHLRSAPLSSSDSLDAIPVDRVDDYTGKILAGSLPEGTLLSSAMLVDTLDLPAGTSLVGVPLSPSQTPTTQLRPGDRVTVVMGASSINATLDGETGLTTPGRTWEGQVVTIGQVTETGLRTVDLAVASDSATGLAAAVATGNVSVVLHPHTSTDRSGR